MEETQSVTVEWTAEDIMNIRPTWDYDKCSDELTAIADLLQERSIEFGFDLLDSLLDKEEEN